MTDDPRAILAFERMSPRQAVAVALCVVLTALDGFDVLAISFASPGIAQEWGIDRASLGIVLSMEIIGMALGSLALGNVADRFGRRPTVLGCLLVMTAGMFLATTARGVEQLSLYRFMTGLGIGGMLAAISAVAAEFSSNRRRNLAVTLMAAGYPLGAVFGGLIATQLLAAGNWRSVFMFGGFATAACIPLVVWLLPESVSYMVERRPPNALARVNETLRRLGHRAVSALPSASTAERPGHSLVELFTPQLARTTTLLTIAYFAHIMTFYFILKWIPKIVVDMGFEPASAGGVLVWANVGGATGSLVFSVLTQRVGLRPLVIGALLLTAVMVVFFGRSRSDLTQLAALAACTGFFCNAGIVGLYAMFAQSFPAKIRATGTGFVIGMGRGGAALGPIAAGFLFVAGSTLPVVAAIMAVGSLAGAVAIMLFRYEEARIA
ncbi:MAG TPA: MFS transporter [Steroidobacteraceae bacterium]